jgi:hypothetical protein
MPQDGQALDGPAAAGDNQPGIGSPFRGQVPGERITLRCQPLRRSADEDDWTGLTSE